MELSESNLFYENQDFGNEIMDDQQNGIEMLLYWVLGVFGVNYYCLIFL